MSYISKCLPKNLQVSKTQHNQTQFQLLEPLWWSEYIKKENELQLVCASWYFEHWTY